MCSYYDTKLLNCSTVDIVEFKVHIPRGFSARRLDCLGNCGVRWPGAGALRRRRAEMCYVLAALCEYVSYAGLSFIYLRGLCRLLESVLPRALGVTAETHHLLRAPPVWACANLHSWLLRFWGIIVLWVWFTVSLFNILHAQCLWYILVLSVFHYCITLACCRHFLLVFLRALGCV